MKTGQEELTQIEPEIIKNLVCELTVIASLG